eukprot:3226687-Pleurochrysis_carterae.AAC.3
MRFDASVSRSASATLPLAAATSATPDEMVVGIVQKSKKPIWNSAGRKSSRCAKRAMHGLQRARSGSGVQK